MTFEGSMKFELEESARGACDEELLEDMRRCAKAMTLWSSPSNRKPTRIRVQLVQPFK
jgi:hypothetical protein